LARDYDAHPRLHGTPFGSARPPPLVSAAAAAAGAGTVTAAAEYTLTHPALPLFERLDVGVLALSAPYAGGYVGTSVGRAQDEAEQDLSPRATATAAARITPGATTATAAIDAAVAAAVLWARAGSGMTAMERATERGADADTAALLAGAPSRKPPVPPASDAARHPAPTWLRARGAASAGLLYPHNPNTGPGTALVAAHARAVAGALRALAAARADWAASAAALAAATQRAAVDAGDDGDDDGNGRALWWPDLESTSRAARAPALPRARARVRADAGDTANPRRARSSSLARPASTAAAAVTALGAAAHGVRPRSAELFSQRARLAAARRSRGLTPNRRHHAPDIPPLPPPPLASAHAHVSFLSVTPRPSPADPLPVRSVLAWLRRLQRAPHPLLRLTRPPPGAPGVDPALSERFYQYAPYRDPAAVARTRPGPAIDPARGRFAQVTPHAPAAILSEPHPLLPAAAVLQSAIAARGAADARRDGAHRRGYRPGAARLDGGPSSAGAFAVAAAVGPGASGGRLSHSAVRITAAFAADPAAPPPARPHAGFSAAPSPRPAGAAASSTPALPRSARAYRLAARIIDATLHPRGAVSARAGHAGPPGAASPADADAAAAEAGAGAIAFARRAGLGRFQSGTGANSAGVLVSGPGAGASGRGAGGGSALDIAALTVRADERDARLRRAQRREAAARARSARATGAAVRLRILRGECAITGLTHRAQELRRREGAAVSVDALDRVSAAAAVEAAAERGAAAIARAAAAADVAAGADNRWDRPGWDSRASPQPPQPRTPLPPPASAPVASSAADAATVRELAQALTEEEEELLKTVGTRPHQWGPQLMSGLRAIVFEASGAPLTGGRTGAGPGSVGGSVSGSAGADATPEDAVAALLASLPTVALTCGACEGWMHNAITARAIRLGFHVPGARGRVAPPLGLPSRLCHCERIGAATFPPPPASAGAPSAAAAAAAASATAGAIRALARASERADRQRALRGILAAARALLSVRRFGVDLTVPDDGSAEASYALEPRVPTRAERLAAAAAAAAAEPTFAWASGLNAMLGGGRAPQDGRLMQPPGAAAASAYAAAAADATAAAVAAADPSGVARAADAEAACAAARALSTAAAAEMAARAAEARARRRAQAEFDPVARARTHVALQESRAFVAAAMRAHRAGTRAEADAAAEAEARDPSPPPRTLHASQLAGNTVARAWLGVLAAAASAQVVVSVFARASDAQRRAAAALRLQRWARARLQARHAARLRRTMDRLGEMCRERSAAVAVWQAQERARRAAADTLVRALRDGPAIRARALTLYCTRVRTAAVCVQRAWRRFRRVLRWRRAAALALAAAADGLLGMDQDCPPGCALPAEPQEQPVPAPALARGGTPRDRVAAAAALKPRPFVVSAIAKPPPPPQQQQQQQQALSVAASASAAVLGPDLTHPASFALHSADSPPLTPSPLAPLCEDDPDPAPPPEAPLMTRRAHAWRSALRARAAALTAAALGGWRSAGPAGAHAHVQSPAVAADARTDADGLALAPSVSASSLELGRRAWALLAPPPPPPPPRSERRRQEALRASLLQLHRRAQAEQESVAAAAAARAAAARRVRARRLVYLSLLAAAAEETMRDAAHVAAANAVAAAAVRHRLHPTLPLAGTPEPTAVASRLVALGFRSALAAAPARAPALTALRLVAAHPPARALGGESEGARAAAAKARRWRRWEHWQLRLFPQAPLAPTDPTAPPTPPVVLFGSPSASAADVPHCAGGRAGLALTLLPAAVDLALPPLPPQSPEPVPSGYFGLRRLSLATREAAGFSPSAGPAAAGVSPPFAPSPLPGAHPAPSGPGAHANTQPGVATPAPGSGLHRPSSPRAGRHARGPSVSLSLGPSPLVRALSGGSDSARSPPPGPLRQPPTALAWVNTATRGLPLYAPAKPVTPAEVATAEAATAAAAAAVAVWAAAPPQSAVPVTTWVALRGSAGGPLSTITAAVAAAADCGCSLSSAAALLPPPRLPPALAAVSDVHPPQVAADPLPASARDPMAARARPATARARAAASPIRSGAGAGRPQSARGRQPLAAPAQGSVLVSAAAGAAVLSSVAAADRALNAAADAEAEAVPVASAATAATAHGRHRRGPSVTLSLDAPALFAHPPAAVSALPPSAHLPAPADAATLASFLRALLDVPALYAAAAAARALFGTAEGVSPAFPPIGPPAGARHQRHGSLSSVELPGSRRAAAGAAHAARAAAVARRLTAALPPPPMFGSVRWLYLPLAPLAPVLAPASVRDEPVPKDGTAQASAPDSIGDHAATAAAATAAAAAAAASDAPLRSAIDAYLLPAPPLRVGARPAAPVVDLLRARAAARWVRFAAPATSAPATVAPGAATSAAGVPGSGTGWEPLWWAQITEAAVEAPAVGAQAANDGEDGPVWQSEADACAWMVLSDMESEAAEMGAALAAVAAARRRELDARAQTAKASGNAGESVEVAALLAEDESVCRLEARVMAYIDAARLLLRAALQTLRPSPSTVQIQVVGMPIV
jgi:hypothetical protein